MIKSLRKTFTRTAAGVGLALGLAATAQAGTISLGHTTWVGYGTLYLARDLGYFKEQGLDVQFSVIEESALYMAAQASGKLSGSASTIDEILKYRSEGFCFKAVAALDASHGGDGVLVRNDVNDLTEIKGKAVAVNEGSVSHFWLNYLLQEKGMTLDDIEIQNMTSDDAATAFIAGRVPVAVTWEPHLSLVKQKGEGKVLIDSSQTPGVIVDVVALNCDVIEKQPEDVKALVKGLYKAVEFTKQNPEKAYEIMAKGVGGYLSDPKDLAEAAQGVIFYDQAQAEELLGVPGKTGEIAKVIDRANTFWSELHKKDYGVTYEKLVDPSFVSAE